MVDIQSATAEIRRGKTERKIDRKKQQDKNIMSASATQGGHKNRPKCRKIRRGKKEERTNHSAKI